MSDQYYFVYIMANFRPTLYVGVTNNLFRRVQEHKNKLHPKSFCARYNLNKLVYYESGDSALSAIVREKQIKNMNRADKIALIKTINSDFKDLFLDLFSEAQ